ncbi:MAG TPA: ATP-binding protein [Ktedonobacterales bacterium]
MTDALQRLQTVVRALPARTHSMLAAPLYLYRGYHGRWLALVFVSLLLAMLGSGLLALRDFGIVAESERIIAHMHAVEAQVAAMERTLDDAERGQEGYLLTGNAADLALYVSAHSTIGAQVAHLRALTAGDTTEQACIRAFEPLIPQVFAILQQTIDLRAQQRMDEALAIMQGSTGQRTMTSIRTLLDVMDAREARLLDERLRMREDNLTAAQITVLLGILADVALLAVLFVLVSRTFAAREQYLRAERTARATAEAAVAQRDQFLSIASHELRTPLTILQGNFQLLERRLSRTVRADARLHQSFAAIHRQLVRLQALINAMLDVSRIEQGQLKIAHERLDFAALVRAIVDEVQPTAPAHPIELVISPDTSGTMLVWGDRLRLEQVLLNLLQNAIKYSPGGGPIRVEVTRTADRLSLSVSDRGQGIPKEALPHLFERFYRAPNVSSEHISGMGIGLYLVREIVDLHDGTITVASEQGVGTTFTAHLPLAIQADTVSDADVTSDNLPAPQDPMGL